MTNPALATRESPANPQVITALALIETTSPAEIFANNGLDALIERVEQEARSAAIDISTKKGRDEVASLAHKIARSKTALDKAGKDLVAGRNGLVDDLHVAARIDDLGPCRLDSCRTQVRSRTIPRPFH